MLFVTYWSCSFCSKVKASEIGVSHSIINKAVAPKSFVIRNGKICTCIQVNQINHVDESLEKPQKKLQYNAFKNINTVHIGKGKNKGNMKLYCALKQTYKIKQTTHFFYIWFVFYNQQNLSNNLSCFIILEHITTW